MICQNCGQLNETGQNYCRHCGKAILQPQTYQPPQANPKPYGWASPSSPLHDIFDDQQQPRQPQQVQRIPQTPPLVQMPRQHQHLAAGYRCPNCGTNAPPITRSEISDGGWIVFILMLFLCLPLFWVGLLMRDQFRVCPACLRRTF